MMVIGMDHRPYTDLNSAASPSIHLPKLILRCFWEMRRQLFGLLQQEDTLLIDVQPVGGSTSQVEDASPAGQRAVWLECSLV